MANPRPKLPSFASSISAVSAVGAEQENTAVTAFSAETSERMAARQMLMDEVMVDLSDQEKARWLGHIEQARAEIIDHWRKAGNHYLSVSYTLLDLETAIPKCTLTRLLESYDRKGTHGSSSESALPFSAATASRLMAVGRMVKARMFHIAFEAAGQTFEEWKLPPYSVACFFGKLDEDRLAEAVRENLIRPDASQRQVTAFVQAAKRKSKGAAASDTAKRELLSINRKIANLALQMRDLETRRRELLAGLGGENFASMQKSSGGEAGSKIIDMTLDQVAPAPAPESSEPGFGPMMALQERLGVAAEPPQSDGKPAADDFASMQKAENGAGEGDEHRSPE